MPTYYVEDFDGEREDDAAAEAKVVKDNSVEDKAVAKKTTSSKSKKP